MNAVLNINVRVVAQQARAAFRDVEGDVRRMERTVQQANASMGGSMSSAAAGGNRFASMLGGKNLVDFGKNLQWTGRQLEYSFTLPILAAGAAATKFELDNQRAMANVTKVYGDFGMSVETRTSELRDLSRSFELLSNRFGVNKSEVIEVGAAWAQAGASGVGLARSVQATMEAMIVGGMSAEQATTGLIAIQSSYNLSSQQLLDVLADLNAVENQTAIGMQGLIEVITRAGGTARTAGISIQELAAMAAALVPAAGSAAQAGNALRTIISRIMSPTQDAADLMQQMGINIESASWQSQNAMGRIQTLSKSFMDLSDAQKTVVSASVASRWQINRFDLLMEQVNSNMEKGADGIGYYTAALNAMSDHSKAAAQYQRELNTRLGSQPQQLSMLLNILRNTVTQAIQPMIPALIVLLKRVTELAISFSKLSPETQQLILVALGLLAALGPVMRYMGALSILGGYVGKVFRGIAFAGKFLAPIISFLGVNFGRLALFGLTPVIRLLEAAGVAMFRFAVTSGGVGVRWAAATAVMSGRWALFTERFMISLRTMTLQFGIWARSLPFFISGPFRIITAVIANLPRVFTGVMATLARAVFYLRLAPTAIGVAWLNLAKLIGLAPTGIGVAWLNLITKLRSAWLLFTTFLGVNWINALAWISRGIAVAAPAIVEAAGAAGAAIAAAFSGPVGWIVLAVVAVLAGVLFALHKFYNGGIRGFITDMARAWNALPRIIAQAMVMVVTVLARTIQRAMHWLSYLNPFARHSPSLVDNVTAGVDVILNQYSRLRGIGSSLAGARNALADFQRATAGAKDSLDNAEIQKVRGDVVSAAPGAGPAFDALVGSVARLRPQLRAIGDEVTRQQAVVDQWEAALNAANSRLREQKNILDQLELTERSWKDQLDAAKETLDNLVDTPIAGLGAMEDKIFDNEMAQKRLRLELLKLTNGNDFQKAADQAAQLQGEIEKLRGEATELRLAGAGSEVMGPIEDQIRQMEAARDQLLTGGGPNQQIEDMQKQLEELERQGEILDLEKAIGFDPLQRQIEKVTQSVQEMPFDELYAKIVAQQGVVNDLTGKWQEANKAVQDQQKVVDDAQAARDALQLSYDVENDKLSALKDAYSQVEQAIRDGEQAINDFASAIRNARDAQDELSQSGKLFEAGAGHDFPDVGGTSGIGREEGSIPDYNAELEKQIDEAFKNMGKTDLFKPLKDQWNKVKNWFNENMSMENFKTGLRTIWDTIAREFGEHVGEPIKKKWNEVWTTVKDFFVGIWQNDIYPFLAGLKTWFDEHIVVPIQNVKTKWDETWDGVKQKVIDTWEQDIKPKLQEFVDFYNNYILPVLQLFQAIALIVYTVIANKIKEWWENDVKPKIEAFKKGWDEAGNKIDEFKNRVSAKWNEIKEDLRIWWEENIRPKIDAFKKGWDDAGNKIDEVKGRISARWNELKEDFRKWWDENIKPKVDAFKQAWDDAGLKIDNFKGTVSRAQESVSQSMENMKNAIKGKIKDGIDSAIHAFNRLANAVNGVAEKLNLSIRVSFMPDTDGVARMAAGGLVPDAPKSGGLFKDVRAIVGEGSNTYPEFVIPTDPRYRSRALGLLKQANVRMLAAGDILGDVKNAGADALGFVGDEFMNAAGKVRAGSVMALMQPALAAADQIIGRIPIEVIRQSANRLKNDIYNWAKGQEDTRAAAYDGALIRGTANGTLIRAGERNQSEAIVPLPRGLQLGEKHIHFHGDLSFPNVRSGDDAEAFISNLERLAE